MFLNGDEIPGSSLLTGPLNPRAQSLITQSSIDRGNTVDVRPSTPPAPGCIAHNTPSSEHVEETDSKLTVDFSTHHTRSPAPAAAPAFCACPPSLMFVLGGCGVSASASASEDNAQMWTRPRLAVSAGDLFIVAGAGSCEVDECLRRRTASAHGGNNAKIKRSSETYFEVRHVR